MYEQLIEIVKQAGAMIREAHEAEIPVYDKEGIANFVTKYDKDVQSFLIRNFRQLLPEANSLRRKTGSVRNLATVIVSLSIRSTVRPTLSLIINQLRFRRSCMERTDAVRRCVQSIYRRIVYGGQRRGRIQERKADPQQ